MKLPPLPPPDKNSPKVLRPVGTRAMLTIRTPARTRKTFWLSDSERLEAREAEVLGLFAKCTGKHRKYTLRADGRKYPTNGADLSTRAYVRLYLGVNSPSTPHYDNIDRYMLDFFQPLATRITPVCGEYSESHDG